MEWFGYSLRVSDRRISAMPAECRASWAEFSITDGLED